MKTLISTVFFLLFIKFAYAQTAAELGPNSLTLPRLTSTQRNALSPAKGNIIFNTTSNQMEYYDGNNWVTYVSVQSALTSADYKLDARGNLGLGTNANANISTGNQNVAIGSQSMTSNRTGSANVAVGYEALRDVNNANGNTAVGTSALRLNQAYSNTALGAYTLFFNTTGSGNTALGANALTKNGIGYDNTAVGYVSLWKNVNGNENATLGTQTLFNNVNGNSNIAIGTNALYSNVANHASVAVGVNAMLYADNRSTGITTGNTAVGYEALMGSDAAANNIGTGNTAIGFGTMKSNTSGSLNSTLGYQSLAVNSTGEKNNAFGHSSLLSNTTGSDNVAIGSRSLVKNVGGNVNIAIGSNSLAENINGHSSIGIGGSALKSLVAGGSTYNSAIGEGSLLVLANGNSNDVQGVYTFSKLKEGSGNIAMGREAGSNIVYGSQNVFLGTYSNANTDVSNAIAIGYGASVSQSNIVQLGNSTITQVKTAGVINANGLAINGDPKPSAVVDLSNSKKGFLPPKLLATERDAIVSPEQGLIVFCTNCGPKGQLEYYDGSAWVDFMGNAPSMALQVGATYQGGKIAYVYQAGDPGYDPNVVHGLIVATVDQTINTTSPYYSGTGCMWENGPYPSTYPYMHVTNASGTALGEGKTNTKIIIDVQTAVNRIFAAANFCYTYRGGGYSDWVLPSKDELNKVYLNKSLLGSFSNTWYWTSSETADPNQGKDAYAYAQHFQTGSVIYEYKGPSADQINVRAIRYF